MNQNALRKEGILLTINWISYDFKMVQKRMLLLYVAISLFCTCSEYLCNICHCMINILSTFSSSFMFCSIRIWDIFSCLFSVNEPTWLTGYREIFLLFYNFKMIQRQNNVILLCTRLFLCFVFVLNIHVVVVTAILDVDKHSPFSLN